MPNKTGKNVNIEIDGSSLTIEQICKVAYSKNNEVTVSLKSSSLQAMKKSNDYVYSLVKKGKPVYGINTGFGALSNVHIKDTDLEQLQLNLIRSHCAGVGKPFSREVTRAIMLLRANCLASGFSGITPQTVQLILDFINCGVTPVVPEKGSVGASGDLAPLAHIALALIGEGDVEYQGKIVNSGFAINHLKKTPAKLGPKDGLALINGTAVMAALGCIAVHHAKSLIKMADISACITLEGLKGSKKAYSTLISSLKPHKGQVDTCENLNRILTDSEIAKSHENCGKVQDPYSLRCVPQVHGAIRQTIKHAEEVINVEINSVTDNPLIFCDQDLVLSGGNFHGEALALCMDYLAMGLSEICSISERRIEKMMNPVFSSLPAFLTKDSGLNSGLMIAHVTAAALASENKYLCHPASIDSIPTSTDKEDHVSMGVTSGRKLLEVLENTKLCLSIELLCGTQALSFHSPLLSSPANEAVHKTIRNHVSVLENDRTLHGDINKIKKLIDSDELLNAAEAEIGVLL